MPLQIDALSCNSIGQQHRGNMKEKVNFLEVILSSKPEIEFLYQNKFWKQETVATPYIHRTVFKNSHRLLRMAKLKD
jgi:hypothetical protein